MRPDLSKTRGHKLRISNTKAQMTYTRLLSIIDRVKKNYEEELKGDNQELISAWEGDSGDDFAQSALSTMHEMEQLIIGLEVLAEELKHTSEFLQQEDDNISKKYGMGGRKTNGL